MPLLVKTEPSAKLLKVPEMGDAEVLLITVKTVPTVKVPVLTSTKVNVAPLLMVTPRALTFPAMGVLRSNTHLSVEREA